MARVSIVGAAHTAFGLFARRDRDSGRVEDEWSFADLLVEVGRGAIADARLEAADIDAIYVGSCSPGSFVHQEHVAPLAARIAPSLLQRPMSRCEGACASSSVALYNAIYAIEAGRARRVLVIGVEKMSLLTTAEVASTLAGCSDWPSEGRQGATFPKLFAQLAETYRQRHGIRPERLEAMLAAAAALGYRHGADNPLAQIRDGPQSTEAVLALKDEVDARGRCRNPEIAPPLRLHDCAPVSDGAAALVLCASAEAGPGSRVVDVAGIGHCVDELAMAGRERVEELTGGRAAARLAFAEAGIGAADLDLIEVHDCFTINTLLSLEAIGLAAPGRAGDALLEGRFTRADRTALNLSGGLKAKGHPVGATGASMHALLFRQLVGEPIGAAAARAELALAYNMGGAGVTHCVSVLRRRSV